MSYKRAFTSLSLVCILGACSAPFAETTRSAVDPLSFQYTTDATLIEDQADALNRMAGQLVRRSTIGAAGTGALVTCGLAVATAGNAQSCITGAAIGGATGAAIGHAQGEKEVQARVELVSADALVRSLRGMNGQMDALELGLPEVLAEQNAEFRDMEMRREVGAISPMEYNEGVAAIRDSRARITEALTLTISQANQAGQNLELATSKGQSGLEWHLGATAELAREAHSARSLISPLGHLTAVAVQTETIAQASEEEGADTFTAAPDTQIASAVQAPPPADIVTISTTTRTKTRRPLFNVPPRSGVLR